MSNSIYSGGPFKKFVSVMALVSVLGGGLLWYWISGLSDSCHQRAENALAMQNSIDDASIALGRQIQEWKDMLLRANDADLYGKHKSAYFEYNRNVEQALLRTKTAMQGAHMETASIEQLIIEHNALSSDYFMAKSLLDRSEMDSFREVDKKVIGIDRGLQKQLAAVRADIILFSRQQLNEAVSVQGYLVAIFGACALWIMALAGFVIANWLLRPVGRSL